VATASFVELVGAAVVVDEGVRAAAVVMTLTGIDVELDVMVVVVLVVLPSSWKIPGATETGGGTGARE
jgi:hypothetical protein